MCNWAPSIRNWPSNCIWINLPKRDELSLRRVRALPKASSSGLDASTCSATAFGASSDGRETRAR